MGGLVAGPLILYGGVEGAGSKDHPPALVLGPSSQFDVARLMRVGGRLVGGVQGMIASIPPGYEVSFLVSGKTGVNAAMVHWGATLQRAHATRKLSLAQDALSRQLHYENDNGANYCYCHWYPACKSSPAGCVPMHETLEQLKRYHASLNLSVGHYHLDPFWWSHRPLGGCEDGASAPQMTASPFHFPSGLAALDLDMMLIVKVRVRTRACTVIVRGVRCAIARGELKVSSRSHIAPVTPVYQRRRQRLLQLLLRRRTGRAGAVPEL